MSLPQTIPSTSTGTKRNVLFAAGGLGLAGIG